VVVTPQRKEFTTSKHLITVVHVAHLGFEVDVCALLYQQLSHAHVAVMCCYVQRRKITLCTHHRYLIYHRYKSLCIHTTDILYTIEIQHHWYIILYYIISITD